MAKAESADADAQFRVGNAYDFGKGAPQNKDEAIRWYTMAAEQNHLEAQNSIGSLLQEQKKYDQARFWYEKASSAGHALATNSLAYLYDLGLGVPQDRKKGFELYSRSADLGWAQAMWNLANMYGAGQLGPVDMKMACVWARRAQRFARPGDAALQQHLQRVLPRIENSLPQESNDACVTESAAWSPPGLKAQQ